MNKILASAILGIFILSCNDSSKKKDDEKKKAVLLLAAASASSSAPKSCLFKKKSTIGTAGCIDGISASASAFVGDLSSVCSLESSVSGSVTKLNTKNCAGNGFTSSMKTGDQNFSQYVCVYDSTVASGYSVCTAAILSLF